MRIGLEAKRKLRNGKIATRPAGIRDEPTAPMEFGEEEAGLIIRPNGFP